MSTSIVSSIAGSYPATMDRSLNGERIYKIRHLIVSTDKLDGPFTVLNTPGVPAIGSDWNFGTENDEWAFCTPEATIRPKLPKEPNFFWEFTQTFSSVRRKTCEEELIEDPLLEPQKVSGGFSKFTEEISFDRFGNTIENSSFEPIKGPQVEFDKSRHTIRIEQNVATLELELFSPMVDTVNDETLWGFARRKVKLSDVQWDRKVYGSCNYYYTRSFFFDTHPLTFDRDVIDEGAKVLAGSWNTDCTEWVIDAGVSNLNPLHFQRFHDCKGNLMRTQLDGKGEPIDPVGTGTGTTEEAHSFRIEYYPESDFLLLGIPVEIDL